MLAILVAAGDAEYFWGLAKIDALQAIMLASC